MRRAVALVLLCASPAWARPCARVVPVTQPCEGVAMPLHAARECARAVVDVAACREELAAADAICEALIDEQRERVTACDTQRRAQVRALERTISNLRGIAIKPPPAPGWYESPWLWAGIGAIIGGASAWTVRGFVR